MKRVSAFLILVMILLSGCLKTGQNQSPETIAVEYTKITPEEAQEMMDDTVIILDVRTQEEYDEGHIPNALLVPDTEIKDKADTALPDKEQTILVYCRSGRRSASAAKELLDMGYTKVFDFGGILYWNGKIEK